MFRLACSFGSLALLVAMLAASADTEERYWIAGRYDGDHVIVYFQAVKFRDKFPPDRKPIVSPVVSGFLEPVPILAAEIARFRNLPGAEPFAVGDVYDLLTGGLDSSVIRLSRLVYAAGDEGAGNYGNYSYIGALAKVEGNGFDWMPRSYYVVRRHRETVKPGRRTYQDVLASARLSDDSVRFDFQARAAAELTRRMRVSNPKIWAQSAQKSPGFAMQTFHIAGGEVRYLARAEWKRADDRDCWECNLSAWMSPTPTFHVLAFETANPVLLNVVQLDNAKTGIIVSILGEDIYFLQLREYHDGMNLGQMRLLQDVGSAE